MAKPAALIAAVVLKDFPYAADGMNVETLKADAKVSIAPDLFPGLKDAGFVTEDPEVAAQLAAEKEAADKAAAEAADAKAKAEKEAADKAAAPPKAEKKD